MIKHKLVPKTWGLEVWYANLDYCGKMLIFAQDHRCSMHYHIVKHETFVVMTGRILLEMGDNPRILEIGQSVYIPRGIAHRMTAVGGNASMIEFSSHHEDSDSYRVETGQAW